MEKPVRGLQRAQGGDHAAGGRNRTERDKIQNHEVDDLVRFYRKRKREAERDLLRAAGKRRNESKSLFQRKGKIILFCILNTCICFY